MEQNGGNLVRWKRAKPNAEIYGDGARLNGTHLGRNQTDPKELALFLWRHDGASRATLRDVRDGILQLQRAVVLISNNAFKPILVKLRRASIGTNRNITTVKQGVRAVCVTLSKRPADYKNVRSQRPIEHLGNLQGSFFR